MLSLRKLAWVWLGVGAFVMGSSAVEPISTGDLWSKFETTRKAAPTLHQEFAVTQRFHSIKKSRGHDCRGSQWPRQHTFGNLKIP